MSTVMVDLIIVFISSIGTLWAVAARLHHTVDELTGHLYAGDVAVRPHGEHGCRSRELSEPVGAR